MVYYDLRKMKDVKLYSIVGVDVEDFCSIVIVELKLCVMNWNMFRLYICEGSFMMGYKKRLWFVLGMCLVIMFLLLKNMVVVDVLKGIDNFK